MCLSHLIYTVRCRVWFTVTMPMPCSDHSVLLKAAVERRPCCARTNRKVDSSLPCQRLLLLESMIEDFCASGTFFGLQLGNVCFSLNWEYVHGVECVSRNWRLLSWSRNLASFVECRVSWRCSRRPNLWIRCRFSWNSSQTSGYLMYYQVWLPEILHCARRMFFPYLLWVLQQAAIFFLQY